MRVGVAMLATSCLSVAPKGRIEPHERVAIELRGADALELDLPASAPDARALEERFAVALKRELVRRRSIAPDRNRADALLAVRLIRVALEASPENVAALRISAGARIESAGADAGKARTAWRASEWQSPARPRAYWSDAGGRTLDTALATGLQAIAEDLVGGAIRAKEKQ